MDKAHRRALEESDLVAELERLTGRRISTVEEAEAALESLRAAEKPLAARINELKARIAELEKELGKGRGEPGWYKKRDRIVPQLRELREELRQLRLQDLATRAPDVDVPPIEQAVLDALSGRVGLEGVGERKAAQELEEAILRWRFAQPNAATRRLPPLRVKRDGEYTKNAVKKLWRWVDENADIDPVARRLKEYADEFRAKGLEPPLFSPGQVEAICGFDTSQVRKEALASLQRKGLVRTVVSEDFGERFALTEEGQALVAKQMLAERVVEAVPAITVTKHSGYNKVITPDTTWVVRKLKGQTIAVPKGGAQKWLQPQGFPDLSVNKATDELVAMIERGDPALLRYEQRVERGPFNIVFSREGDIRISAGGQFQPITGRRREIVEEVVQRQFGVSPDQLEVVDEFTLRMPKAPEVARRTWLVRGTPKGMGPAIEAQHTVEAATRDEAIALVRARYPELRGKMVWSAEEVKTGVPRLAEKVPAEMSDAELKAHIDELRKLIDKAALEREGPLKMFPTDEERRLQAELEPFRKEMERRLAERRAAEARAAERAREAEKARARAARLAKVPEKATLEDIPYTQGIDLEELKKAEAGWRLRGAQGAYFVEAFDPEDWDWFEVAQGNLKQMRESFAYHVKNEPLTQAEIDKALAKARAAAEATQAPPAPTAKAAIEELYGAPTRLDLASEYRRLALQLKQDIEKGAPYEQLAKIRDRLNEIARQAKAEDWWGDIAKVKVPTIPPQRPATVAEISKGLARTNYDLAVQRIKERGLSPDLEAAAIEEITRHWNKRPGHEGGYRHLADHGFLKRAVDDAIEEARKAVARAPKAIGRPSQIDWVRTPKGEGIALHTVRMRSGFVATYVYDPKAKRVFTVSVNDVTKAAPPAEYPQYLKEFAEWAAKPGKAVKMQAQYEKLAKQAVARLEAMASSAPKYSDGVEAAVQAEKNVLWRLLEDQTGAVRLPGRRRPVAPPGPIPDELKDLIRERVRQVLVPAREDANMAKLQWAYEVVNRAMMQSLTKS